MFKTKKNGFLKASGIMLAFIMLATGVISGTMAKYKSEGTATVPGLTPAKWEIDVAGKAMEDTIDLTEVSWKIYEGTDNAKESELGDKTITPGTWGYFEIKIENKGNVDALVKLDAMNITATNDTSDGLDFKVIAKNTASAPENYSDTGDSVDLTGSGVVLTKENGSVTLYVCFQWLFEGHETQDTPMGKNPQELTMSSLTITAEQAAFSN